MYNSEKEKFLARLDEERKKGLTDFKVCSNPDRKPCNKEEIYAELNRMWDVMPSKEERQL